MGLLEQAKAKWQGLLDYIDANTPRHAGALPTVGRVVDQGLINPNRFNKPSADRFKESTFGLLGIVPGVGDYASVVESADLFNRGEKFAGGMAALGALPLVPAIGGMFIGKGAKTWDALKAQQADELLKQGIDPREVWKQTGTMKGVDGALRQEIPDNLSQMTDLPVNQSWEDFARLKEQEVYGRRGAQPSQMKAKEFKQFKQNRADWENLYNKTNATHRPVGNIMQHDALYEAYPDLRSLDSFWDSTMGKSGSFGRNQISFGDVSDPEGVKGLFGHELQHAIQQREGWARGGSPDKLAMELQAEADLMRNKAKSLFDLSSANDPLDPGRIVKPGARKKGLELERQAQKLSSEANRINEFAGLDHDAYRRLAGEAEARLTQARMNMTMPERLQSYPYDMLDVPQDQLIVRGLLDGPAMSHADEAAQGGGLLGKVDNAGMSAWKQNDVFGNGKQIEHLSPDGKSAVVQQTLPNGKTVFYPADVDATYGWVRPDMYKRFDSFEAAQKSIKGMRISDAAKKRNTELYGNIPNTWTGDAKKVAKKLIDNGFDVSRFSSSTQSKSKYIELADGRKIRLSDHDLPSYYEGADFDFRYGGDISELIGKLK